MGERWTRGQYHFGSTKILLNIVKPIIIEIFLLVKMEELWTLMPVLFWVK